MTLLLTTNIFCNSLVSIQPLSETLWALFIELLKTYEKDNFASFRTNCIGLFSKEQLRQKH